MDKNRKFIKFSRDLESDWTVKNDTPHYGLKEHASIDVDNGFILSTIMTKASFHDSPYLPYSTIYSHHTQDPVNKVYVDKGYFDEPNTAKLTEFEILRNKSISKKRYIVEQYFGLSHLHDRAYRARFTTIIKNTIDAMCRQFAFNLSRGANLLGFT